MSLLSWLLAVKIAVTFVAVAAPFLFLSKKQIDRLSGYTGAPIVLYRLYGVAILALLVGYGGGLHQTLNGVMPWGVVCMGIVSNAGATAMLAANGEATAKPAPTAIFGLVTIGLIAAAALPETFMAPL